MAAREYDPSYPGNYKKNYRREVNDDIDLKSMFQYVENPEFAEVHVDARSRIIYGVKSDGDFYFGAGIPSQIKDYIDQRIPVEPEE